MKIVGNMVGCYSPMGKSFILVDEIGNEVTGIVVGQETVFTAVDSDVVKGKVYGSNHGVSTGTLECTCNGSGEDEMFVSSAGGRIPEYECGVATSEFELDFETSAIGALQE